MTISKVTHAYQHLAAQAELDKHWAGRVELAVTDHALWLDRHKLAGNDVDFSTLRSDWRTAQAAQ
jgi:hypothetical protein